LQKKKKKFERPTWATLANGASSIGLAIGIGSTGVVVARVQRAAEHKRKKILYNLLKFY
jgi:hypothetical protein